jgi:Tfp pilus assembly protein PilF
MKIRRSTNSLVVLLMLTCISTFAGANTVAQYIEDARIRTRQGDFEAAAVMYQKVLKLDEDNLTARKELANVLLEAQLNDSQSDQTEVELAALREIKPGTPYSPMNFPLNYLSNVAVGSKDEPFNFEILLALTQLQKGENESVIKTANTLQKKSPTHPVPHNLLGLAWAAKGETSKARDHYEKALSLKQDFHAARINLAELEIRTGEYQKAKGDLSEVLKKDKNNRRACLLMAKLSELEGNRAEAKRWYQLTNQNY